MAAPTQKTKCDEWPNKKTFLLTANAAAYHPGRVTPSTIDGAIIIQVSAGAPQCKA